MMDIWNIAISSVVQGITEFLPISSSAHLQLIGKLMDVKMAPAFEIALHLGTIFAVIIYFARDIKQLLVSFFRLIRGKRDDDKKLLISLLIATIPIILIGGALSIFMGDLTFRNSLKIIGWTTLIFGILLQWADKAGLTICRTDHLRNRDFLFIGFAQVLAIIPGVSRSGITITAMRFLGVERAEAARFSMLMSIPVILIAASKTGVDLLKSGDLQLTLQVALAAALSFIVALSVIAALMAWVKRATFRPFVIYRIILGIILLLIAYGVVQI